MNSCTNCGRHTTEDFPVKQGVKSGICDQCLNSMDETEQRKLLFRNPNPEPYQP